MSPSFVTFFPLLTFTAMSGYHGNPVYNDTQTSDLSELLSFYCPDTTLNWSHGNEPVSCCAGCSSHESCGSTDSCCFEHDDKYTLIEEGILRCTVPSVSKAQALVRNAVYYKLVVGPPRGGCIAAGSCMLAETPIPWKSFYPVFSREKRLSYITESCAKCHGVRDGIKWHSIIIFGVSDVLPDLNEVVYSLSIGTLETFHVLFEHPGTAKEVLQAVCSEGGGLQTCDLSSRADNRIRNYLNHVFPSLTVSRDELFAGCTKGPRMPYFYGEVLYKNVFCAVCNLAFNHLHRQCYASGQKLIPNSALSIMINYNSISQFEQEKEMTQNIPKACKGGSKEDCRPVLCPSIQVRDSAGTCRYLFVGLYANALEVSVHLTTTVDKPIDNIFTNATNDELLSIFHERSPWQRLWEIYTIETRFINVPNGTSIDVVIVLHRKITGMVQNHMLVSIWDSLSENWKLSTKIGVLSFKQTFLKHRKLNYIYRPNTPATPAFGPGWVNERAPEPVKEFETRQFRVGASRSLRVTKLFFCQQVELEEHEWAFLDDGKIELNITLSKTVLFQNEVLRLTDGLNNTFVRICVEDSGLQVLGNKAFRVTSNDSGHVVLFSLYCLYTILALFAQLTFKDF